MSPHSQKPQPTGTTPTSHLAAVERWALVLSVGLMGGSLLFAGPRFQLGALVGAGLSLLNARALTVLVARLQPRKSMGLLIGLFQLKLGLLAALIYLALKLLPIQPLAMLLGLSVLPLAILLRGIQFGLRPFDPNEGQGSPTGGDAETETAGRDSYADSLTEN